VTRDYWTEIVEEMREDGRFGWVVVSRCFAPIAGKGADRLFDCLFELVAAGVLRPYVPYLPTLPLRGLSHVPASKPPLSEAGVRRGPPQGSMWSMGDARARMKQGLKWSTEGPR